MKTILVCNQKGGVGKSLIADEIAYSFERTGTPINFYDLDGQGGTLHKTSEKADAEISIVDTPGALQPQMGDWMKAANLIVIPTRTTARDIEPLRTMRDAVLKNNPNAKVIYVFNGYNGRYKASRDFDEFFNILAGEQIICRLPQSELFVQAGAENRSVVEKAPKSTAGKATFSMVNSIRKAVDELEEKL